MRSAAHNDELAEGIAVDADLRVVPPERSRAAKFVPCRLIILGRKSGWPRHRVDGGTR